MNGAHAELFTFCLYHRVLLPLSKKAQLAPLIIRDYESVSGTDLEPRILLAFAQEEYYSNIKVEFRKGSFVISIDCGPLHDRPDVDRFAAIRQSNVKRMLAYSSIAHAGYVLVAEGRRQGMTLLSAVL